MDRYFDQEFDAYEQDEYTDAYWEQYSYIEDCIKADKPIQYSGIKQLHIDNCDFYDLVGHHQAEILKLIANKDDAGLLKKIKQLYNQNMTDLIDLTIG